MISLTAAQYEAIGEVTVQSGTLERELVEYNAFLCGTSTQDCAAVSHELATASARVA